MTEQLLLGKSNGSQVFIEPFHTLLAGQTNLSGKTSTIIALAGEAVKLGYTLILFDTKPTMREFENFHDIPVCYQVTTDPLVLIGLLEAKRKAKLSPLYATLGRITERAKSLKDIIANAEEMEKISKSGFIKDACYTLADLLRRIDEEFSQIRYSPELELEQGQINVMPINKMSSEAQQLILKTAFEQVLTKHNRRTIVVVDEAFRFFPQDYSSACKKSGQDLITQGARTKCFVWISTQFIAPTDKDPLKACPNKLFGRQDDDTEIQAIQKRIPGGRSLKADQLMTLKRGEFWYVPIEGKPKKVLVTPPWERKTPEIDLAKVRVAELAELVQLRKDVEELRSQATHQFEKRQEFGTPQPVANGPITHAPSTVLQLDHSETIVQVRHTEPTLAKLSTKIGKGQIVYVLVNELKGGPANKKQILDEMLEYGWTMGDNTFNPNVGGLIRDGYLLREGESNYRIPGKVKVEVIKE